MQDKESRRAILVKRLLSLNLSTKKELQDIVKLTSVICKTPIVLITLLDDEQQYIKFNVGIDAYNTSIEDAFCRYTIMQDEVMEVADSLLDERFCNNNYVTGDPYVRFYAGSPLKTQSGESLGSLCVIDSKPNILNEDQKQMLQILSRQITTILEFELSLKLLKEEIAKVQESEIKLKSIFQSSPTLHILVDRNMIVLAYNKSAADFIFKSNNKVIKEGESFGYFINANLIQVFTEYFQIALSGEQVRIEQMINYDTLGNIWWEVDFNPVLGHNNEIIGISLDATNITERVKYKEDILIQNAALKEIAQIQSHEIRRPVANIICLVDLLQNPKNEYFNKHLQYMKDEVLALDKTIHSIVQLSNCNKADS